MSGKSIYGASTAGSSGQAISGTGFLSVSGLIGPIVASASKANIQLKMQAAGTISHLQVGVNANTRNGACVFKININGTDGTGSVTVPSSSGATTVIDNSGTDTVASGDLVCLDLTTFGGSTGSLSLSFIAFQFEPTSGAVPVTTYMYYNTSPTSSGTLAALEVASGIFGGTRAAAFLFDNGTTSDNSSKQIAQAPATYSNLRANVSANTVAGVTPSVTLYQNGIATGLTVSLSGTGVTEDTTHTVTVAKGDALELRCQLTGRTSGSITFNNIQITATGLGAAFDIFGTAGQTLTGFSGLTAGTTVYTNIFNPFYGTASSPTALGNAVTIPFRARAERFNASFNPSSATSTTLAVYKNSSAGNQSVTSSSATLQNLTDTTDHDDLAANDTLALGFTPHATTFTYDLSTIMITPMGDGTSGGSATVTGTGIQAQVGAGSTSGTATVSGVGKAVFIGQGTAGNASLTVSGVGRSLAQGTGTAGGSASLFGDFRDVASGVGTAGGSATVSGVGESQFNVVASAGGQATVSGVGRAIGKGVGSAAGSATVGPAPGVAAAITVGTTAGRATVSGVGGQASGNFGLSSGKATVSGVGIAAEITVGTTAGSATVSGVGRALGIGVGSAAGSASVSGSGGSFLMPKLNTSASATANSTNPTVTLSTSAGDWIVVIVSVYSSNASETSFSLQLGINVSSPSINSWGLRRRYAVNTGLGAGNTLEVQEWAAPTPSALTSEVITVTVNNPQTAYVTVEAMAVSNSDPLYPWDTGVTSAAERDVEGTADANSNHPVSYTVNSPGFTIEHLAEQNGSGSTSVTVDSGWTSLGQLSQSSSLYSHTAYKTSQGSDIGSHTQNVWSNDSNLKEYIAFVDSLRPVQATWLGPQYVDCQSGTWGSAFSSLTSTTLNLQSTLVAGNVAIAFISITGSLGGASTPTNVTWPAGWTKISEFKDTGGSHPQTGSWAWRKIDGTEGSSITVSWTNNAEAGMCQCMQFSGANTLGPIGNYHTNLSATNNTSVTNTAATTTANNSLVVNYLDYAQPDPTAAPDGYTARKMGSQVSGVIGSWHISDQPITAASTQAASPNVTEQASAPWLSWNFELLAAPPGATAGGHATVSGVGGGIYVRTATIAAAATVSGVGRSLAKGVGTAGGQATVTAGVGTPAHAGGSATVSGHGITARIGVGHAGGSATVDGENPAAFGGADMLEQQDFAQISFIYTQGTATLVETTDAFSAYATQPIPITLAATERPDSASITCFTAGASVTFGPHDPVDTFHATGYTASVGTFSAHESADIFRATTAGAVATRRRRVFFTT